VYLKYFQNAQLVCGTTTRLRRLQSTTVDDRDGVVLLTSGTTGAAEGRSASRTVS